jgi:hypothetical protein
MASPRLPFLLLGLLFISALHLTSPVPASLRAAGTPATPAAGAASVSGGISSREYLMSAWERKGDLKEGLGAAAASQRGSGSRKEPPLDLDCSPGDNTCEAERLEVQQARRALTRGRAELTPLGYIGNLTHLEALTMLRPDLTPDQAEGGAGSPDRSPPESADDLILRVQKDSALRRAQRISDQCRYKVNKAGFAMDEALETSAGGAWAAAAETAVKLARTGVAAAVRAIERAIAAAAGAFGRAPGGSASDADGAGAGAKTSESIRESLRVSDRHMDDAAAFIVDATNKMADAALAAGGGRAGTMILAIKRRAELQLREAEGYVEGTGEEGEKRGRRGAVKQLPRVCMLYYFGVLRGTWCVVVRCLRCVWRVLFRCTVPCCWRVLITKTNMCSFPSSSGTCPPAVRCSGGGRRHRGTCGTRRDSRGLRTTRPRRRAASATRWEEKKEGEDHQIYFCRGCAVVGVAVVCAAVVCCRVCVAAYVVACVVAHESTMYTRVLTYTVSVLFLFPSSL